MFVFFELTISSGFSVFVVFLCHDLFVFLSHFLFSFFCPGSDAIDSLDKLDGPVLKDFNYLEFKAENLADICTFGKFSFPNHVWFFY